MQTALALYTMDLVPTETCNNLHFLPTCDFVGPLIRSEQGWGGQLMPLLLGESEAHLHLSPAWPTPCTLQGTL